MTLHEEIITTLVKHAAELTSADAVSPEHIARVYLELGNVHGHYREYYKAQECWVRARTELGLKLEMSGAMGVRTKFQQKQTAQLCLAVEHGHTSVREEAPPGLPTMVELNDDTRLEGGHTDTHARTHRLTLTHARTHAHAHAHTNAHLRDLSLRRG